MNTRSAHGLLAFTLIELLTVITIIAILMGLLFPVLGIVKDRARMAEARNDVLNIVAALNSYSAEYAKLPPLTASDSGSTSQNGGTQDVFIGDPAAGAKYVNSKLFNILRAIPEDPNTGDKLNPRRIVFFQTKSVSDPDNPRAGFLDRVGGTSGGNKGSLYDPWGNQYNIILDSNYDNLLDVNQAYIDFSDNNKPRIAVGAFSLGKDNKLGDKGDRRYRNGTKASDDIISWQ